MEWFIKKSATLPVLKINVLKDGRSDYNKSMRFLNETQIFFSMTDTQTGVPKIISRPAGIMKKKDSEDEYYVYFQFTNHDTKKVGRYKGEFQFKNETGLMSLPLNQDIYINVTESFVGNDTEYSDKFIIDYPCCKSILPFKPVPPTPPTTTSTTDYPFTTTSTTDYPFTTTSTTDQF